MRLAWPALTALCLVPSLSAAEPRPLRAATATLESALQKTSRTSPDCQTVLSGNLQAAKGMIDRLKLDWTPQGARQATDWLNTTAAAGGLGGCPDGVLSLIRRAASQVADSGEELPPPRAPGQPGLLANPCGGIAELAHEWSELGDYLEEHQGQPQGPPWVAYVSQHEKGLLQRSVPLVRTTMASSRRFQKLGARLLGFLIELDRIDDDADWSADISLMLRIEKTIRKISDECSSFF